jgi:hypothetical protein
MRPAFAPRMSKPSRLSATKGICQSKNNDIDNILYRVRNAANIRSFRVLLQGDAKIPS